jgi:hypothetical protein
MFKVLAFVKRKPGLRHDEFRNYYETRHAALIAAVAPITGTYRRNFLEQADPVNVGAEDLDFDVVTEMEFADRAQYERWFALLTAPGILERVQADEANFIDRQKFRVCAVQIAQ